jgi:hypothetical protein
MTTAFNSLHEARNLNTQTKITNMTQMQVDERNIISFNYSDIYLPESVRALKPTLFKVGDLFCCLLGPNPKSGIFGCGNTMRAAVYSWNLHFQEQLKHPTIDEEVMHYINGSLMLMKLDLL